MMRKLIVLAAIAAGLFVSAAQASACSDLGFMNSVQRANLKASYGNDLLADNLYGDAASAFASALRMVDNSTRPCASGLINVRSTYRSALIDWQAGARYFQRGSLSAGLRTYKRGTTKVKYATAQMKYWNENH
jgi:hypothetical protein